MSENFEREEIPARLPGPWKSYDFDEGLYWEFMRRLEQEFKFIKQDEIGGGLSGARTSSVRIDPRHSSNAGVKGGQYILKVCLSEDAKREIKKHTLAKDSLILCDHVPELVATITYPDMPLTGIFYQVAGGSQLTRTTLQKGLEQDHFPIPLIEELAKVILKWNFELIHTFETSDLLGFVLEGLGKDHLEVLRERLKGIGEHLDQPRTDLTPFKIWRYNPVHFLLSQKVLPSFQQGFYVIPVGTLHRDLHPANIIIPAQGYAGESFYIIDFAASSSGNAFFDLAYLEISVLLNSPSGFHSLENLKSWWRLEEYLSLEPLPSDKGFTSVKEGLRLALPIRRALFERMELDGMRDDYWMAFLAASVEAGLDLARKVYRDPSRQRMAFLTAVSRFHHLVELLRAIEIPPGGPQATIYWPGEKPPPGQEKGISSPGAVASPLAGTEKAKVELAWPGEITRRGALYDPWMMVDEIWSTLTGGNDQGVLLIGERKFGKSSFFNSVGSLFPKQKGDITGVRLDTLNNRNSIQSFATQLLGKMCRRIGLQKSPVPYNNKSKDFDIDSFFSACQSVVEKREDLRLVVCVDEIDSTLNNTLSEEDAKAILHLLYRLLTDPELPIRLLLTASSSEVLRHYSREIDFVDSLRFWSIPLCSEAQIRDLIERFDVPVTFAEDALSRIFHYAGGQIYLVKLAVNASIAQIGGKNGKKIISAQLVDDVMHAVIEPHSSSSDEIRNLHEAVFPTMSNIYEKHFSADERRFMQLLNEAGGILRASSFEVSEAQLANTANVLYRRRYVSKLETEEDEVFSWRIGLWQLFLENRHQFNHRKNQGKQ